MGNYLNTPVTEKNIKQGQNNKFEYCAASMQGWRANMEDAHITLENFDGPDKSLFGVFDGHGGNKVALFVEKYFVEELKKNQNYQKGNYNLALEETFLRMDELIETPQGKQELQNQSSGCTANVCLIVGNTIYCANSGDSRTVISEKGNAVPLSIDHKPDDEIEKKRIQNAGGDVYYGRVNGNLNLSRALGDMEYKVNLNDNLNKNPKEYLITAFPDVQIKEMTQDDVKLIILGCDGIWECRSNQEIVDYFQDDKQNLKELTENFLDSILATSTGGQMCGLDNMSIIVVRVKN